MRGACVGTVVCATNRSVASTLSSEKSNESDNESDEASDASSDSSRDSSSDSSRDASRDEDDCTDCTSPAGDRGALHMPQDVARCGFKY